MSKIVIAANEANQRLDRFLRKYYKDTSLTEIYKMIRKKDVRVNGRKVPENYRLLEGDELELKVLEQVPVKDEIKPAGRDFATIFEDENVLIVDKPPQLILHPDAAHKENTLVDQVLYYLYKTGQYDPSSEKTFSPAAVNRLDLNTGGIVIIAKNYSSLQALSEMMRTRAIKKHYISIVKGVFKGERTFKAYLAKDTKQNIVSISQQEQKDTKEIHTHIKSLDTNNGYSLIEIDLITGRSHQIRAHLASMNHPLIGDVKYGEKETNNYFRQKFKLKHQFLYAYKIYIEDTPEGLSYLKGRTFTVRLPEMYCKIIGSLFKNSVEGC